MLRPRSMWARPDVVWGLFAVPERDLGVLGDVRGLDVVELACGTAYFSAWLARAGAKPVAVDLSGEQLATARRLQGRLGPVFPLVQGDAERVPLAERALRPRGQRARSRRVVRPRALAAGGGPAAAAGRAPGLPDQQPPVGPVRPRRGGVRRGTTAARSARGLPGALARGRDRVPSLARRLGAAAARLRLRRRGHARDLRAAGRRRPPLLRDRVADWATRWPAEELWVATRRVG